LRSPEELVEYYDPTDVFGDLADALAEAFPSIDPAALAYACRNHLALVQVPPRGLWGESGQARWALAEAWLGARVDPAPETGAVVLRYLAAFGPATVADLRTWSGVTGLRAVVERLRPRLRTYEDERGRELLDVEDGVLPDPGTPAPPRFLPEYDNVVLSHADRSRILASGPAGFAPHGGGWLLVDGFHRAHWHLVRGPDAATITIDRYEPGDRDPPGTPEAIAAEATALIALLAPDAAAHRIEFIPSPSPRPRPRR
jgi:hypothetical protein